MPELKKKQHKEEKQKNKNKFQTKVYGKNYMEFTNYGALH